MHLKVFKNTVLFFVLMVISCGNNPKEHHMQDQHKLIVKNEDNRIVVGANRLQQYLPELKGKRVGIVANQTSVIFKDKNHKDQDVTYTHLVDSLLALDVTIKHVFSPEHGFRGTADAGELVKDGVDTKTGLPIFSLHGKHKKPAKDQLEYIDVMVFDIQDVGVRFYTYISTLHYVMEACAEHKIPLIILDRPNPNGNYVDGPVLEAKHKSFLGMHPIPLVHGMTIGEYAHMINGENWLNDGIQCTIKVIELINYTHQSSYSIPIRPSPNLPNDQAITLYPSLGLFEGTNINAGRGTEYQFQRYGAPFLDKNHYTFSYTPVANFGSKYPKHENTTCYGEDLSSISVKRELTLKFVIDAYKNAVDKSKVFNTDNFTKHAGTESLQKQIEAGLSEAEIKTTWREGLLNYKVKRAKYLLYPEN
ncbi:MAG: DUF1343 domain-containing protein [Bacteroidia bacterium]|nr:DUF1343 domain-containing protein [Bacteroidia bacterium]